MSKKYSDLEDIELQTPSEIAQISEIRVPVVKAMAYIKFAIKESEYEDSVDMTSAMATDATHELLELDSPKAYITQAVLSLENAITASEDYPTYQEKLIQIRDKLENLYL